MTRPGNYSESERQSVRAIVTDLHMPGMDGFELMEKVRSHQMHRGVPIIVITGCTDVDAPEQARLVAPTRSL